MEEGGISNENFRVRYRLLEGLIHAAVAQIDKIKSENGLDVDTALDYLSHLLWNSATLRETSDLLSSACKGPSSQRV
jgi:hypothetical protein